MTSLFLLNASENLCKKGTRKIKKVSGDPKKQNLGGVVVLGVEAGL